MAGGSVANTIRGLSSGFGISSGIIGACGDDEQGQLFVNNMSSHGVDLSRLQKKKGHTAQCVCLVDELANRTMRPCLSNAVKVQAQELMKEDFKGSKWLVLRYAVLNLEVIQAAIDLAKQEGLLVSLDLASFEMNADPIAAVEFLAKYCEWAVVTLGSNGCIARHGKEMIHVSAIGESKATDATGAAPYVLTVNRNQSTHFSTSTVNSIANQASVIREL
ncbi:hypothetical protein RYX36_001183 [Vicia faba]